MTISNKTIFILRLALGWIFFYAGFSKVMDPAWSAAGLLSGSQVLPSLYHWFASPGVLSVINFVNEWGLLLLGVSLLLGLFVRLSSSFGILLMALYYLPQLNFPIASKVYFLIDVHVIFILGLVILIQAQAGQFWGLEQWLVRQPVYKKSSFLKRLVG